MISARKINETGKGKEELMGGGQGICSFRQDDQQKYQVRTDIWGNVWRRCSSEQCSCLGEREESKYQGPRAGCLVWKQDSERSQRGSRAGGLRESIRTWGQEVVWWCCLVPNTHLSLSASHWRLILWHAFRTVLSGFKLTGSFKVGSIRTFRATFCRASLLWTYFKEMLPCHW